MPIVLGLLKVPQERCERFFAGPRWSGLKSSEASANPRILSRVICSLGPFTASHGAIQSQTS